MHTRLQCAPLCGNRYRRRPRAFTRRAPMTTFAELTICLFFPSKMHRDASWHAVWNVGIVMKTIPTMFLSLALPLVVPAAIAHADDRAASGATTTPYSAKQDLSLDVSTGMFESDPKDGGFLLNGTLLHRIGYLEYGLDGTYGDAVLSYEYEQLSAAGGVAWQTPVGLRLEALGEFGGTYYRHVGTAIFSANPGAYGLMPTARARAGVSYVFVPRGPAHVSLGLWGYGEDDLGRRDTSVTFTETAGFGNVSPQSTTTTERLGAARTGAMVSLGGTFDL